MITIKDFTISYEKTNVIDGLQLNLENGHIHGLVGLNGSGKTTLLRGIQGLLKIKSGLFELDGLPLSKKEVSYLPTENYFYPNITAQEYLSLFQNENFNLTEWNSLFHLPLNQIIDGFSTGMKKKLALLGVLKQNKPIIILDEPFNGLDIESGRTLHNILVSLKSKGKTVIITSHLLDSLTNLCDEIHYLEDGKILYSKIKSEFEEFKKELYHQLDKKNNLKINSLIEQ